MTDHEQAVPDNTPVIIGVGQHSERVAEPGYEGLNYMDLGGRALAEAISDSTASGSAADAIDTLAAIRAFEISRPGREPPFGTASNIPRAMGNRVGANPKRAILTPTGGQTNQQLLGEFAEAIATGESQCAAIVGAEAISTVLALVAKGEKPDWSEEVAGDFEDQGFGIDKLIEPALFQHNAISAIPLYALAENARRAKLGLSIDDYRLEIGKLFAPFTRVAAANLHAAAPVERSAEELATITERNRIVAEPYARMTVARDQVNQSAAIIVASAGKARELGVPQEKWVHIHAVTAATELPMMQRPDLSGCPASIASAEAALERAGKGMDEMAYLDFYSCFAIPVFNQVDHFDLSVDDPRGLTLTGGLPFFGGAGNNYSAHAIVEAIQKVRLDRGSFAFVGANGGWMSKYSSGIYSTEPADWSANDRFAILPEAADHVPLGAADASEAVVETYTIHHSKKGSEVVWIGRDPKGGRIAGNADLSDEATRTLFEGGEPFGATIAIKKDERGRNIARAI
ncbi:MAG: acetyl-CoA acetyltransferase [Pseudomonadota bacterium]